MFDFPVTKMYIKARHAPLGFKVTLTYETDKRHQVDLLTSVRRGLIKHGYTLVHQELKNTTITEVLVRTQIKTQEDAYV